jgi:CheY-like chemotaxis protein
MRFSIDVVFLDWDLEVLKVVPRVRPFRIASCRPARTVLELAEGEIERLRLEPGQRLELVNEAGAVVPAPGATRRPRVVLASGDGRFVSVTSFLLTRHGYDVETTDEPASVVAVVEEAEPDVVVIDASDGTIGALRSVAALETLYGRVGVVVVADSSESVPLKNMPVLDKWSAFDGLRARIAAAAADSAGAAR